MLLCTKCKQEKPDEAFCRDRSQPDDGPRRGRKHWCRQCFSEYHKAKRRNDPDYVESRRRYARENKDKLVPLHQKSKRKRHEELKLEVIQAYGGACTCCGESDPHFLTIEHIGGVPDRHRWPNTGKRISGSSLLYKIKQEGFPDDITVLCFNCNCAIGQYGFCPHQEHEPERRRYAVAA